MKGQRYLETVYWSESETVLWTCMDTSVWCPAVWSSPLESGSDNILPAPVDWHTHTKTHKTNIFSFVPILASMLDLFLVLRFCDCGSVTLCCSVAVYWFSDSLVPLLLDFCACVSAVVLRFCGGSVVVLWWFCGGSMLVLRFCPLTSRLSNFLASVMWIQLSFSITLMCFTSSLNLKQKSLTLSSCRQNKPV